MSLIDTGGEPFVAYPSTDGESEFGAAVRVPGDPDGLGIKGRGMFTRPDSTPPSEVDSFNETLVLSTRSFPFGALTVVRYQGRLWDVVEEPLVRRHSRLTTHVSVVLHSRTVAAR